MFYIDVEIADQVALAGVDILASAAARRSSAPAIWPKPLAKMVVVSQFSRPTLFGHDHSMAYWPY